MEKIEWTKELALQLIDAYRSKAILWDPKHPNYYNKQKKNEAWEEISNNFEFEVTAEGCKKKINSLLSALRRERIKMKQYSKNSESGYDDTYESSWFAFKSLVFLWDKHNVEESQSTIEEEVSNDEVTNEIQLKRMKEEEEIQLKRMKEEEEIQLKRMKEEEIQMCDDATTQEIYETDKNQKAMNQLCRRMELMAKRRKRRLEEAASFKTSLRASPSAQLEESECQIFGKLVAKKLAKYSEDLQSVVQLDIMNILFQADRTHTSANSIPYHSLHISEERNNLI